MQIVQTAHENVVTIQMLGDFTFNSRRELSAAIERARATSCHTILLNVERVKFMDSAALGVLALYANLLKSEGRRLVLLRPQERVREVLIIANIPAIIPICLSEEDLPLLTRQPPGQERA